MLFYNGRILTMNPEEWVVKVLEISGERISDLSNEFKDIVGGVNLQNGTLLPGLIDTHMHLLNYGFTLKALNVGGCTSINELISRLQNRVKEEPTGNWIIGRGWDENRYGGLLPTRHDLDKVAPDHPVLLSRVCGHLIVVNSKALELCGVNESISTPDGGAIDRDSTGLLTGVFRENAMSLIFDGLPETSFTEIEEALTTAGEALLRQGITTVHTDDLGGFTEIKPVVELYRKLYLDGKIPKVHLHIKPEHIKEVIALGYKTGTKLDGITIGSVKIFTDGSLGARTAAMCADYSDAPGEKGILCYSDQELYQVVKAAHNADLSVAIHGIGDAAITQAVEMICRVQDEENKPELRHCLIHAQILNDEIMDRMLRYNIIAEIQPIFINTDLHWAESRVGERIRTSYNWQSLWQKGIHLAGSSDCPVEPVNPLWGIYASVTRKDLEGNPPQGWYPEEGLSLEQALQLFTINGAYTGFEEGEKGSLAIGKVADLVILDRPIDQIPYDEIKDVQVCMTILNGKIVYQKK